MRINKITSQPNFQAVNQKYFEWAKKDYSLTQDVSINWMQNLSFDVFLFRKISRQDAIDTVVAVKKYMNIPANSPQHWFSDPNIQLLTGILEVQLGFLRNHFYKTRSSKFLNMVFHTLDQQKLLNL